MTNPKESSMREFTIPDALPVLSAGHHPVGSGRACVMDGCGRPIRRKRDGVCNAHRQRIPLDPLTDEDRFWAQVQKSDGCWEWIGGRYTTGYGVIRWGGRQQAAHRVVLKMQGVEIPIGMDVCHHCDNRRCVRPDHLYIGTRKQNMADCTARGRHNKPRGEGHWCAKLTDAQVAEIRQAYRNGNTQKAISEQFNVHAATISRIVRNEWRAA